MDVHADMRRPAHEAALRAVQKPPAKPWRGGSATAGGAAPPPPPPKVYRVEPREFRELVQRLTGAPAAPRAATRPPHHQHQHHQTMSAQPQQPVAVRAAGGDEQQQQQLYAAAPWFSFPLAGLEGHHSNGALI